ncbi:hypothetical protein Sliba_39900 [Streptomyces nigrescens]|uniref:Uncharacterized protein n=1 Tax=Streptomyces nigrescens TaxID=1920 RepID=A0A640TIX4_STRNI|nr:hypothetical protein Sliba_39900 [Streptomyces libani subsp. libani]GGV93301.1 hypothetical protein GCM10010500_28590 [Streptomyces libani subsp. libani]
MGAVRSAALVVSAGCVLLCSYMPIPLRTGPVGPIGEPPDGLLTATETIVERGTGPPGGSPSHGMSRACARM